jgi:5-methylcytosine-specific restriction endonuclease McrA
MARDTINPALLRRLRRYNTQKIDHSLTLFQLYVKYSGVCQKCQCKTIFGQHPPVDDSATIEHIIPISNGGNHVYSNVTLLCQKCNYSKNTANQTSQKEHIKANPLIKFFSFYGYKFYYKKVERK